MIPLSFQGHISFTIISFLLLLLLLLSPFFFPLKPFLLLQAPTPLIFFNFEHPSPYNIPCTLSSLLIPRTISLLKHACFSSHLPISFLSHPFSLSSYYPQLSSPETSFHPLPWVSRISTVPVVRLLSPIMENFPNFITLVEEGG